MKQDRRPWLSLLRRPSLWASILSGAAFSALGWAVLADLPPNLTPRFWEWNQARLLWLGSVMGLLSGLPAALTAWVWTERGKGGRATLMFVAPPITISIFALAHDIATLEALEGLMIVALPLFLCGIWASLRRPTRSLPRVCAVELAGR